MSEEHRVFAWSERRDVLVTAVVDPRGAIHDARIRIYTNGVDRDVVTEVSIRVSP